jgi:hypothetical protein
MTTSATSATDTLRIILDQERRRDRLIRRLCIVSWTVTILLVLVFAAMVAVPLIQMLRAFGGGMFTWSAVIATAMPLVGALWTLSLLVAALSTVGVFLRFRSASLAEIQLRLAALEDLLGGRPEGRG